jgi:hypothetical protein
MITTYKQRLQFPAKIAINDPQVILKEKYENSDEYSYYGEMVVGDYYRVIPTSPREIDFFAGLKKYEEVFAPAKGNGLIVRADVIDTIDPPPKNLK